MLYTTIWGMYYITILYIYYTSFHLGRKKTLVCPVCPGDRWWKKWLRCRYRPSLSVHALCEYLSSAEVANDPPLGLERVRRWSKERGFMRELLCVGGWRFEPSASQEVAIMQILWVLDASRIILRNWGSFIHHSRNIEPVATWHLNSKLKNYST
jgi:hypothetical protein